MSFHVANNFSVRRFDREGLCQVQNIIHHPHMKGQIVVRHHSHLQLHRDGHLDKLQASNKANIIHHTMQVD